jgi:hypothetical protein
VSQLRRHESELTARNVSVFIVSFDSDLMAQAYAKSSGLKWPVLIDKDRVLYQAYGFEQMNAWTHFNPVSIAKYLGLTLKGYLPGKPGVDWQQLGGDVLLDPQGTVRLIYRSNSPHDRPSVSSILSTINRPNF